jgi:hypothetical protein
MSIKKAQRLIQEIGASLEDYARIEAELLAEFGCVPAPRDVFWRAANEIVVAGAQRNQWSIVAWAYWKMAYTLFEDEQPHQHLARECERAFVLDYLTKRNAMNQTEGKVLRILANACCEECEAFHLREYTFDEALEENPLPPSGCTNGWCSCSWDMARPKR